jgi:hypothetical protein
MGNRWVVTALLAASILGAAPQARAASFTILGGEPTVTLPDDQNPTFPWWGNQVIPDTPGFIGGQLAFQGVADLRYDITFEFLGFEALWVDELRTGGGSIDNRQPPGTAVAVRWRATGGLDIVPFSFVNGDSPVQEVMNGANGMPTLAPEPGWPNFFLAIAGAPATSGTTVRGGDVVLIALDDHGAGPDVDHDDWVGIVRAEPVPEPSALLLLGVGLLSLGKRRRR